MDATRARLVQKWPSIPGALTLLVLLASIATSACSKTLTWEEEVPLNNGETIWVKRTRDYTRQGEAGNPFDVRWNPGQEQTIEFSWRGKAFRYTGDAMLMLLAIDPTGIPVLVARASDHQWHTRHGYMCTRPFYVELVPDRSGQTWTWPPMPGKWLYGMPGNLMVDPPPLGSTQTRYTAAQRLESNIELGAGNASLRGVDPTYTDSYCRSQGS